MTIKEFCESHGVQVQTVSMYMKRHPELFAGLTNQGQDKRSTELTDEAVYILEKKYPYPEPVNVYHYDPEDRKRIKELEEQIRQQTILLTRAQELIAHQQQSISELNDAKALLASVQIQLDVQTENLTSERQRVEHEIEKAERERQRADQETAKAHAAELERLVANRERDEAVSFAATCEESLKKAQDRVDQAQEEITRLKNRNLWGRIFNR